MSIIMIRSGLTTDCQPDKDPDSRAIQVDQIPQVDCDRARSMSKRCTSLVFDGRGVAQIDLTADGDVPRVTLSAGINPRSSH